MASSPPSRALSPPGPHLSLPKKRPSVNIPGNQPALKRRKPSTASLSAHPLRQTSFPPADRFDPRAYSPDTQGSQVAYSPTSRRSESLDVDDEINSVVSARTTNTIGGKTRAKKTAKTGRVGRPPKSATRDGTASIVDGDTTSSRNNKAGTSTHAGQDGNEPTNDDEEEGDDDDANEEGGGTQMEGGIKLTRAAVDQDKANKATFQLMMEKMNPRHAEQLGLWNSIHLNKNTVRKLTNQTLSQSVPASVVNAIAAYTKLFAGEIIDRAREVQGEWVAAAEKLPT